MNLNMLNICLTCFGLCGLLNAVILANIIPMVVVVNAIMTLTYKLRRVNAKAELKHLGIICSRVLDLNIITRSLEYDKFD